MPAQPEPAVEPLPTPSYPTVEAFVESATPGDLETSFASLREALGTLKGPRAEQGKKVETALRAAEELLQLLLGIRQQLEEEKQAGGRRR